MGGSGEMAVGQTRQDANSAPTSSHQPTQRGQQQEQETPQAYKDWQDLINSLQRISTELSKEEENPRQDIIQLLAKEIKRATESRDQDSPPKRGQEQDQGHQLDRIETEIQALRQELNKTPPLVEKGPEKGQSPRSWANIAAQQAQEILTTTALNPQVGTTIRIRPESNLKGKPPKDLLEIARTAVPAAFAVRPLRSGDLDLYVKTQAIKDKILNGPNPPGFKVLRKDYLLEIPSVPLST
jgi:hypothetical protein